MSSDEIQAPARIAINIENEPYNNYVISIIDDKPTGDTNDGFSRHKIPIISCENRYDFADVVNAVRDIREQIDDMTNNADDDNGGREDEGKGISTLKAIRMIKYINRLDGEENRGQFDPEVPSEVVCCFDHNRLEIEAASRARVFQIILPSYFLEPKAKSYGDLMSAESSSSSCVTLGGSASDCVRLIKLYLFLLTTEKGIRLCWNGDLKKEKVMSPDGNKLVEVTEDRLNPNLIFDGFSVQGNSDSHEFVMINLGGEKVALKRVQIYQQLIPQQEKQELTIENQKYELFPASDHELYSTIFSIQDPRISIGRGIQRLISINAEAQVKADKDSNIKRRSKVNTQISREEDLFESLIAKQWEFKCDSVIESIQTPRDYLKMLKTVSTYQKLLTQWEKDPNQQEWFRDNKIYDPCVLLSIKLPVIPDQNFLVINEVNHYDAVVRDSVYLSKQFSYSRYTNNLSMFTDDEFNDHPQLNWESLNIPTAVFDKLSNNFYKNPDTNRLLTYAVLYFRSPNRVINLPFNNQGLDYMTFAAMYIPFLINSIHDPLQKPLDYPISSEICPFPPITASFASDLESEMITLRKTLEVKTSQRYKSQTLFVDEIRKRVFGVSDVPFDVTDNNRTLSRDIPMADLRRSAFEDTEKFIMKNTRSLPSAICKLVEYWKQCKQDDSKFSLIERFYEPAQSGGFGWELYNVSICGNFWINYYKLQDEVMSVYCHHKHIARMDLGTLAIWFLRTGRQPCFFYRGSKNIGKSFLLDLVQDLLISGTAMVSSGTSKRGLSTNTCFAGFCLLQDELSGDANEGILATAAKNSKTASNDKKEATASGAVKTQYSKGIVTRYINKNQVTIEIKSIVKMMSVILANVKKKNLIPSTADRFHYEEIAQSNRSRIVEARNRSQKNSTADRHEQLINVIRKRQIFSALAGMLIRSGAIPYSNTQDSAFASSIIRRVLELVEANLGFSYGDVFSNRFKDDIILQCAESAMLNRVWVQLCSVNIDIHYLDGTVKKAWDIEEFGPLEIYLLGQAGMFSLTFEDAVTALSFVENQYSFVPIRYFLKYIESLFLESGRKYNWKTMPHEYGANASCFWSDMVPERETAVVLPVVTTNAFDFITSSSASQTHQPQQVEYHYQQQQKPLHQKSVPYYDYNYLKLPVSFKDTARAAYKAYPELEIISDNAALMAGIEVECDSEDILDFLVNHLLKQRRTVRAYQRTAGNYPEETSRIEMELPIIEIKKSMGFTFIIILREWYDQMTRDVPGKVSIMNAANGVLADQFRSGILEAALNFASYEGINPTRIPLPGMTMSHNIAYSKTATTDFGSLDLPHIMKVLEVDSPSSDTVKRDMYNALHVPTTMQYTLKAPDNVHTKTVTFTRTSHHYSTTLEFHYYKERLRRIIQEDVRKRDITNTGMIDDILDKKLRRSNGGDSYAWNYLSESIEERFKNTYENNGAKFYPSWEIHNEKFCHETNGTNTELGGIIHNDEDY